MEAREVLLRDAQAAHDRLDELQAEAERRRVEFHQAVRRLHSAGPSMREIAEALGLSHQRVHQIVSGGEEMPTSSRRRSLFNRLVRRSPRTCEPSARTGGPGTDHFLTDNFLVDAREAMSLAQEEARALGHPYLGTEHVLLGLLRSEHGLAARLLGAVGADLERSRAAVRSLLGGSTPPGPEGSLSATPRLKKVLKLARQEANSLQSPHVRSEHLLLGLAREGGGLGARVLADLGVGYEHVRARVNRAWLACSFCGRSGFDVAQLVAGPGVFICERCAEAASQLDGSDDRAGASLSLVGADHPSSTCSFCGKKRADVDRLITAGPRASICGDCLTLCQDIVEEQREAFVPGRG